jgi:hypothetical protein
VVAVVVIVQAAVQHQAVLVVRVAVERGILIQEQVQQELLI